MMSAQVGGHVQSGVAEQAAGKAAVRAGAGEVSLRCPASTPGDYAGSSAQG